MQYTLQLNDKYFSLVQATRPIGNQELVPTPKMSN